MQSPMVGTESIPVVSAANQNKGKKKKLMNYLPFVIIAVVIIAIIITVAIVKSKKSNKPDDEIITETAGDLLVSPDDEADTSHVTFSEDVEVSFEGISLDFENELNEHAFNSASTVAIKPEVKTTIGNSAAASTTKSSYPQITTNEHLEKTTVVTTEKTESSDNALRTIAAFFEGKYYFDGHMVSNGEKLPLELAMTGDDFQIFSEMEGKDISFMNLDSKIYMLNPDTKKYTELTPAVQKMIGIDASQFKFEFNNISFNANAPESVTKATYNGKDAVCYTYMNPTTRLEFIAINGEIVQMTLFENNEAKTVLIADEFTHEIPDEMLGFKGYSKTNMISFMKSLM
ncbi:MAG: hypothetical protein J6Q94_03845 [Clostridia bacterium]|nr:hypothetical protein [Clostridia bacterium]